MTSSTASKAADAGADVHAAAVRHLPAHHRDPFDRLLIAQAQTEPLLLMTDNPLIGLYHAIHIA